MKERIKSLERAKLLLDRGETLECQWGERTHEKETVKSVERLNYLYSLEKAKIQKCELYLIPKETLPEGSFELTFDEAYKLVYCKEAVVYYKNDGEEVKINSISDLIELRRKKGDKLLLYMND
ncbi:MAG: hypothetical protein GX682_01415 [Clostridiaceae bacterium]|nr:hypothetical protein [Clostridiaceae bacterium]